MRRLQRRGLSDLALEAAFRAEARNALATLTRLLGSLDAAEEAVQDAFVVALERWPIDGVPDRPGAWITTIARNKALDRLRREAKRMDKQIAAHRSLAALDGWDEPADSVVRDDVLALVFMCCHPMLPIEARVALALRTLCGLTTAAVARLFLVPEATMAQRLVRAKRRIAEAGAPLRAPAAHELPERLPAVLATVHLLFTEGHNATSGPVHVRVECCVEAVRLSRLLAELMPDEPEVIGLLALVLLTDARRATRVDEAGDLLLLADQDRTQWDRALIDEGVGLVERALRFGAAGRYQLEAAIAACHAVAPSTARTDWREVADLYALLERIQPDPVVRLNRAVAVAEAWGAEAGLDVLDGVAGLDDFHLRWSVDAELRRRCGHRAAAAAAYRTALACDPNDAERRFLEARLAEVTATS